MSYQQYMNMGFGAAGGGHPYMMGFQGGMPMQMQPNPQQYLQNHRPQVAHVSVPSQPAPSKGGKRKLANDPNRPKRPTSAYFYFVQIEREEAAKRGEKITRVAEWTKQISVKWRELTVTQKEQFQIMAATDKARYTQQMAAYTGKDANRPKRPQSAYFLWLADFRARMKNKFIENKDILRAAGEEWRKMTNMSKAPYEQLAEEERRKYEVKMKEYNMNGGSAAKKARVEPATPSLDVKSTSSSGSAASAAAGSYHPQQQQPAGPPPGLTAQQQHLASQVHQMSSHAQQQQQQHDDCDDDDIDDDDGEDDDEDDDYE